MNVFVLLDTKYLNIIFVKNMNLAVTNYSIFLWQL